jgi:hypothetical protein
MGHEAMCTRVLARWSYRLAVNRLPELEGSPIGAYWLIGLRSAAVAPR